ncbi:hypothetical protein TYRP_018323, partial [Tyrophagus putrescentiae]|jgi:hypothetical protein
LFK